MVHVIENPVEEFYGDIMEKYVGKFVCMKITDRDEERNRTYSAVVLAYTDYLSEYKELKERMPELHGDVIKKGYTYGRDFLTREQVESENKCD